MIRYIVGLMLSIPLMVSAIEVDDSFVNLSIQAGSITEAEDLAIKRAKSFLNDNLSQNFNNTLVKTDEKNADVKMLNAKSSVYSITSSKCEKHGETWSCKVGYVYDLDKSKKIVNSLASGKEYANKEMSSLIDERGDIDYEKMFIELSKRYEDVSKYIFSRSLFDKDYKIKSFSYFKNHSFNPSIMNIGFYLENPDMDYLRKYFFVEKKGDFLEFKPRMSDIVLPLKGKLKTCGASCLSKTERDLISEYYLSSLLIKAMLTPGNLIVKFDLDKSVVLKGEEDKGVIDIIDDDSYHESDFLFQNLISLNDDRKFLGKNIMNTIVVNNMDNSFFVNLKENISLSNTGRTKHLRKEGEDTFYLIKDADISIKNLIFSQYFK